MKKYPNRWRDCKPFVKTLIEHQYVSYVTVSGKEKQGLQLYMSDGTYLYMYELWQAGAEYGAAVMRRVVTTLKHRAIRDKKVIRRKRKKP